MARRGERDRWTEREQGKQRKIAGEENISNKTAEMKKKKQAYMTETERKKLTQIVWDVVEDRRREGRKGREGYIPENDGDQDGKK